MKKILTLFVAMIFVFASCSSESNSESSIAEQGNDEKKSEETTNNFTETDTSSYIFSFSSGAAKGFSTENGYVVMTNKNGASDKNKWINYSLVKDYVQILGTGFEAELKLNEQMNFSSVQMFKKNSYDCYYFAIYSNGTFKIIKNISDKSETIFELSPTESKIDALKFNKIKVRTCDSGNVEVYLNGNLVKTLNSSELPFMLTNTDKIFAAYNPKSSASDSSPAQAWLKINSVQKSK